MARVNETSVEAVPERWRGATEKRERKSSQVLIPMFSRALGLLPPADKIDNTVQARSAKRPPANPSINAALLPEMSAQNDRSAPRVISALLLSLTCAYRWRRQSPQRSQRPSQAHSRDRSIGGSGYNTPTSKQDADRSSYSGNAWGQKGRGDVQRQAQVQRQSAPPAATPQGYQEQEHAPVNGFNSKEAKVTMKKCAYYFMQRGLPCCFAFALEYRQGPLG